MRSEYESFEDTGQPVGRFLKQITDLFKKEVELARTEMKDSVKGALAMAVGVVLAGFLLLMGLGFVLTAVVLALSNVMALWLASLIVGAVLLVIGGILIASAKAKAVKKPFERTRIALKEDLRWAKGELDQRRHDLMDWRSQARRHAPKALRIAALAAAVVTAFRVIRKRRAQLSYSH